MSVRSFVRDRFFRFLHKALTHASGKQAIVESLRGMIDYSTRSDFPTDCHSPTPYEDIGRLNEQIQACERDDIIFLTGRFRSGSTLLWNIFRHINGFTSYYEPFNERQWFNPELHGDQVDKTHRGVGEYWREYKGMDDLIQLYREDWIRHDLLMNSQHWNPSMKSYVERLIERSPGRPVLQFNRIDFRLPWFRNNFPNSQIVHIFRHPRDQWCSSLMDIGCFGPESGGFRDFASADKFYLRTWVNDLRHYFPFLSDESTHPYRHFYLLWKLSYLYGMHYSDHSICFEQLVSHPHCELEKLFDKLGISINGWKEIESIFELPEFAKWKYYADDEWFRGHELESERLLADFLRVKSSAKVGNENTVAD